MVSDWIKMRTDLYRDPKVCMMADSLLSDDGDLARYVNQICQRDMTVTRNVTRNAVVGALVTVWGTVRHRGKRVGDDLVCAGAILSVIDDIADIPGFGEAMQDVGWVEDTSEGIVFPRFFAEFNNQPETSSALSPAERQRKYRERKRNVTVTSPVTSPVTSRNDREEKRREEDLGLKKGESDREGDDLPGNGEPRPPLGAGYNDLINMTEADAIAIADRVLVPADFAAAEFAAVMGREGKTYNGVRITSWAHYIKGEYARVTRAEKTRPKANSGGFVNPRHEARKKLEEIDWNKVDRF